MTPQQYALEHEAEFLNELIAYLRIPSISTQPSHNADVRAAGEWTAAAMEQAGLENVRLIDTPRHPLVYGDWLHAGPDAPTILVYGHYDVQPPEPLEEWDSAPFEPVIKGDHLYARGASDDKGQLFVHIKAAQALLQTTGRLPLNVKFLIEGEEESGGESLRAFIPENKALLSADTALISDTHILGPNQPTLVYGLRGNCFILLDLSGPARDLHSGSYGGGVNNPINALAHVLAKLKDENGHILIPGFYDRVRPLSAEERDILGQFPLDEEAWLAEAGAPAPWGEPEYTLPERIGARPTLDVTGIIGGYTGPGSKTVLPATVHAKISMRLVPDQQPDEIAQLFMTYVQSLLPPSITARFQYYGGSVASISDRGTAAMQAAAAAYEIGFGNAPYFMREGGSIPVVAQFQQFLGLETVLMGFGLDDDRIHSPNERYFLPNFWRGIQTSIAFMETYAQMAAG
jgi:acetylornithine deacetylase/succinyl-diaminopimelate desuccinylase-like protein